MLIKMGNSKSRRGNNHGIIVKNYEHYNRSFANWDTPYGKYISSRADYEREMAKQGMVKANEEIKEASTPYVFSKDGQALLEAGKNAADSKGNIDISKLSDMAKAKVATKAYDRSALPQHYQDAK